MTARSPPDGRSGRRAARQGGDRDDGPTVGGDRRRAERGVVPVTSKAAELGIVVLYVAAVTTALYGGVVPDYRTAAADATAEQVTVRVAGELEAAVPHNATAVDAETRLSLPATIRGAAYRVRVNGSAVVLDHPHGSVGERVRLSLPDRVASVRGGWTSGSPLVVSVDRRATGLVVTVADGGA